MARNVNDRVGTDARQRLALLIPDVIGLNGDDPRVDAWLALDAARTAFPIASAEQQRVMAVSVLRCERVLDELEGRSLDHVSSFTLQVLAEAPDATQWAHRFSAMGWGSTRSFGHRSAPAIVHSAVVGVAGACVDDPDSLLTELLSRAIRNCRVWFGCDDKASVPAEQWLEMCELTGR